MTTAIAERNDPPAINALAVTQTMEALKIIRSFVAQEMVDGLDYGKIPGTGDKKTLLLPGAQKATMLFNCYPRFRVQPTELAGGHVEYLVKTELVNRASGVILGAGLGSASTMESKYRWRNAARQCPACGKAAIIKGKEEYGGGFLCFKKKDGCGAKFTDDDQAILSQPQGRVENTDIYDSRNTVLKVAKKRSAVDAAIGLGCLSELFTQDLEDNMPEEHEQPKQAEQERPAQPAQNGQTQQPQKRKDDVYLFLQGIQKRIAEAKKSGLPAVEKVFASIPPKMWDACSDAQDKWLRDLFVDAGMAFAPPAEPVTQAEMDALCKLLDCGSIPNEEVMAVLGIPTDTRLEALTKEQVRTATEWAEKQPDPANSIPF